MTSPNQIDRQRGIKEAGQQLAVLRERWPLAFPVRAARPLALGSVGKKLARIEARNAVKKKATEPARPKPAPTTEKPTQLRDQVRVGLLRRRA